jgi:hypothetical protein
MFSWSFFRQSVQVGLWDRRFSWSFGRSDGFLKQGVQLKFWCRAFSRVYLRVFTWSVGVARSGGFLNRTFIWSFGLSRSGGFLNRTFIWSFGVARSDDLWNRAFTWSFGVGRSGGYLNRAFSWSAWVICTGYSVEVYSGQSVQVGLWIRVFSWFFGQSFQMFEANWVTLFVVGFWVKALGEANGV